MRLCKYPIAHQTLSIGLFRLVWTCEFLFYLMFITYYYHYFDAQIAPGLAAGAPSSWLLCPFYKSPVLEHFLTLQNKTIPGLSPAFPVPALESAFLQGEH